MSRTGVVIVLLALLGAAARAEDGLTVVGVGQVKATPDLLEISLVSSGNAELTGDAIVKYRDALSRIEGAFKQLGIENLTLERQALSIGSGGANAMGMNQFAGVGGGENAKPSVSIGRQMLLRLTGVDKLDEDKVLELAGRLLDTAKDCGATPSAPGAENPMLRAMMGGQPSGSPLLFVVSQPEELRKQAYAAALADATRQAEFLAQQSKLKLGAVRSISEAPVGDSSGGGNPYMAMVSAMYGAMATPSGDPRQVSSSQLGPITVRTSLTVRFAVE